MAPERFIIGVDIGGTKVAAALLRGRLPAAGAHTPDEVETPEIVDRFTVLTDTSTPEACVAGVESCIADLEHGSGRVDGIGIGVASMVDFAAGRIVESVNLPLADVPLRDLLQKKFDVPVAIDNDATAAGIGEWVYGAGAGTSDMIMLTLGTGVGGGIISGGRPLRGFSGAAGELGHIIVDVDGPKCPANCPNWGCLEAYAAGPAMGAAALVAAELEPESGLGRALAAGRPVHSKLLTKLALEGDVGAIAVLERTGRVPGRRARDPEQHLRPGAVRHRRRRSSGGRPALRARPPRPRRPRPAAGTRPRARRSGSTRPRRRLHRRRRAGAHGALPGGPGDLTAHARASLLPRSRVVVDFARAMHVNGLWNPARTA